MNDFPLHTLKTAPKAASSRLLSAQEKYGFLPHLFGKMATAPVVLEAYLTLSEIFERSTLSAGEQGVVLLAAAVENECEFCVAAHTGGAKQKGIPDSVITAVRDGDAIPDVRLGALVDFTQAVVRKRGRIREDEVERFLAAGFDQANVFEVILGISLKTLSNYINHLAKTPLNKELTEFRWPQDATPVL